MRCTNYDCIHINSYIRNNEENLEAVFLYLEEFFSEHLSSKMIFPVCDDVTKFNSRFEFIKKRLNRKKNRYFGVGDKDLKVYLDFVNDSNLFKETILEYDSFGIYIDYRIDFPAEKWMSLITDVCQKIKAYSIYYISDDARIDIVSLLYRKTRPIEAGHLLGKYPDFLCLPSMRTVFSHELDVDDRKKMLTIGWINYWNQDICEFNDFPDLENDFDKNIEIIKMESGGCVWVLTEDAWTIENALHRQKLIEAYQRFPNIGFRT